MLRQKDMDARWPRKNKETHCGYKNPINADQAHKRVRSYRVTDASVHDSQAFDVLLDQHTHEDDRKRPIYADSAYRPKAQQERLATGFRTGPVRKANATTR